MAQLRVLISDTAAENPGGAGVRLANVAPYYDGGDYGATDTAFAEANKSVDGDFLIDNVTPHVCDSGDPFVDVTEGEGGANECWSLIDGFLLVQARQADGTYDDVTEEWLDLGIGRENPDAILKFQALKDTNKPPDGVPNFNDPNDLDIPWRSVHLGLYDAREGEIRNVSQGPLNSSCAIGGIMNLVELDVGNLRRWLLDYPFPDVEPFGGTNGTDVDSASQNGYVFYFSDRRGMLPNAAGRKGEYGFEDVINPDDASGVPNGGFPEAGEDVNQNGILDTYGGANLGDAFVFANGDPTLRIDCKDKGRLNRVSGARRALKLVNGSLGNLPTKPDDTGGFTVATENIVYVMGNYNADGAGYGDPHASAAIIADAANFLSPNWEDWHTWVDSTNVDAGTLRTATTSYFRVAVAAGKSLRWPNPTVWTTNTNWGNDGGTHNFLRFLERWTGETFNYRGSLVSLYYSTYAVGAFKYDASDATTVYRAPTRDFEFDQDFLDVNKLPPGTPRFRDVVNLGMRQIFTPD